MNFDARTRSCHLVCDVTMIRMLGASFAFGALIFWMVIGGVYATSTQSLCFVNGNGQISSPHDALMTNLTGIVDLKLCWKTDAQKFVIESPLLPTDMFICAGIMTVLSTLFFLSPYLLPNQCSEEGSP